MQEDTNSQDGIALTCNSTQDLTYTFHNMDLNNIMSGSIDVEVLDYFSMVLKTQLHIEHGLLPPSHIHHQSCAGTASKGIIPKDANAVQIHYIDGHYVVSCKTNNNITVFDSLNNPERTRFLSKQLKIVYENVDNMTTNYVIPQTQGSTLDCGAFAAANAYYLTKQVSPCEFHLHQNLLRPHLKKCLEDGNIIDYRFPTQENS